MRGVSASSSVPGVLLTGTVGAGKTALATDIGEVLTGEALSPAVIDLDWLGWFTQRGGSSADIEDLIRENLAAIWPNFRTRGATHVVMSRLVREPQQIAGYRQALGDVDLIVVRVTASAETIRDRLSRRDTGSILEEHLTEARKMSVLLDGSQGGDFSIANEGRPIRDVTTELLDKLGWTKQ